MKNQIWQKKWVFGNWKMNGSLSQNQDLLNHFSSLPEHHRVLVGIAAPFAYLFQVCQAEKKSNQLVACAQDVSKFAQAGAFTGEVAASMLQDLGIRFSLVGHSERGIYFQEGNEENLQKMQNLLEQGITPILCVGENLAEREAGKEKDVVSHQLSILKNLGLKEVAVAYEPVWAIGTGKVATTEQIAQMHEFIYQNILSFSDEGVNIRVLYGGSVNDGNVADIFSVPFVDGALVGGASLKANAFTAIINAAQEAK